MSLWQSLTILWDGPRPSSLTPSQGVAEAASHRLFSPLMVVEVLAARVDGGAEDFHIARAPPPTRTVSRMGK